MELTLLGSKNLVSALPYAETPFSVVLENEGQLLADRCHFGGRGYPAEFDLLIGFYQYWKVMGRKLRKGEQGLNAG